MLPSLFGVFLAKASEAALGWAVGRSLDVVVKCFQCREPTTDSIANGRANTLGCRNCHLTQDQFTHATDSTILRPTLQIGHAAIGFLQHPFRSRYRLLSSKLKSLEIPYAIRTEALCQRTAKVTCRLSSNKTIETSKVISPRTEIEVADHLWTIPRGSFQYFSDGICNLSISITMDDGTIIASHQRFVEFHYFR